MTKQDLEKLIQKAAAIAQGVPENLQEAAFNRALDQLLSSESGPGDSARANKKGAAPKPNKDPKHPQPEADLAKVLVTKMDATKHPEIGSASSVLLRALGVLHVARAEHNIDGLTPTEIARVLSDKFRIATPHNSVSDALGKASGSYVDRVKEGRGFRYRIMAPGEAYLQAGGTDGTATPLRTPAKRPRKSARRSGKTTAARNQPGKKSPTKSGGRPGPKAVLESLIEEGFFRRPQTIGDIASHIADSRGRTYKPTDLSPSLVRLLRQKKLSRTKNAEGQYEYSS